MTTVPSLPDVTLPDLPSVPLQLIPLVVGLLLLLMLGLAIIANRDEDRPPVRHMAVMDDKLMNHVAAEWGVSRYPNETNERLRERIREVQRASYTQRR